MQHQRIPALLKGMLAFAVLAAVGTSPALAQTASQSRVDATAETPLYRPVKCKERKAYNGRKPYFRTIESRADFAPLGGTALPTADAAALDRAFGEAQRNAKAKAMTVALAWPDGRLWQKSSETPERLFYWASATKTFTAVVALQLVEEKRLSLDDRLAKWQPDLPNAEHITVRDLLQHTSGLFSANEDPEWRANGQRSLTARQHDDILKDRGAMFCPGQYWRYSNSGYTLLGRIVEAVENRPFADVVQTRIIDRLGLAQTVIVSPANLDRIVPLATDGEEPVLDITGPGTAGPVAASAGDMARFWAALLNDRLVSAETRQQMFAELLPMFDVTTYYGLGAMLVDAPAAVGRLIMLGHYGGAPGVSAWIGYDVNRRMIVTVALTGDGSSTAVANYMLKAGEKAQGANR
ncbi:MAG: serine hydrolase domain-containing protein [Pseudomonadota bacterium]